MERAKKFTRRSLLKTSAVAAGAILAGGPAAAGPKPSGGAAIVIDCHAHLHHHGNAKYAEKDRQLIEAADKLGIHRLCCSILTPARPATADGFRACNRWLAEAAARFSDRVWGYCYVNPECGREAVDEIRRCVDERGFIGVKLYNEYTINDPAVRPVIEKCIELDVPILEHAGHSHVNKAAQPNISDAAHFAAAAREYPEAKLICGHIGGGGDWEWETKGLRDAGPNVTADISGSVTDEGLVEYAIEIMGADRLLFATDMSVTAGVGKFMSAKMSSEDREKIASGNFLRLVGRGA